MVLVLSFLITEMLCKLDTHYISNAENLALNFVHNLDI